MLVWLPHRTHPQLPYCPVLSFCVVPPYRYVIDTGHVKARDYNAKLGLESLAVVPVSQVGLWVKVRVLDYPCRGGHCATGGTVS